MNRWFTSDLHFGHRNVIEYCDRPYSSIEEMDEAIVNQWNSQVQPEDEVYFLGDFGINKRKALDAELVGRLNGIKHMHLGNHDSGFVRMHEDRNTESIDNQYLKAGWESVRVYGVLLLSNRYLVELMHIPPDDSHDNRYSQFKRKNDPDRIYLHGHLHGHYRKKGNMIDVAFDGDLKLLSEDDIINLIEDDRKFIPTRLTEKYNTEAPLPLLPFELEVKQKNLRKVETKDLVLYNYTDHCTFEKNWNEVTLHSRGIIFEKSTGKLIAAPFPKFFNYSELLNSGSSSEMQKLQKQLTDHIANNDPFTVTEKMDGSLGIIYNYKGEWKIATRGSFDSDQAIRGQEILKKYDMSVINQDFTLLVEIIYPENKIVVNYGDEEKLVLLSIVDRENRTELSQNMINRVAKYAEMPLVNSYSYNFEQMLELQKTIPKDDEGFVVRFESGLRVKIKGHEYLRIHKMISQMSPLSFWETMKDGKVNIDYLEELPEEYREEADELTKALEIKYRVVNAEIKYDIDRISNILGPFDPDNREQRKQIGIMTQKEKLSHPGAIFPFLLTGNADQYILRHIRPKGNEI